MRPKATNVLPKNDYILLIEFDNGEEKTFDVKLSSDSENT